MSEQEEQEQGGAGGFTGSAAKALVSAAAAGAATYAVRKALTRNGDGHSGGEPEDDSRGDEPEDLKDENEEETDDAGTGDDDYDDDASENAAAESKLKSVTSGALANASHVLVPLAEGAAEAAGRYVAEHAPEPVRDKLVPRFIEAFEKAS